MSHDSVPGTTIMSFYVPVAVHSIHRNINYRIKAEAEP